MTAFIRWLRWFYDHEKPSDPSAWHKWTPLFPRRLVNGRLAALTGQIWRRRRPDGRWEYRQDEAADDGWLDDAW